MKMLRIVLWALVLFVGAVVAGVWVGRMLVDDTALSGTGTSNISAAFARSRYADAGGPFTLRNTEGEIVTEADFRGQPRAMFFGFTRCPDVCPTTLLDAGAWLDGLGDDADDVTVIFVSVDPEHDRPANLKQYLSAFDERIVGLTADSEAAITELAQAYGIRFEKIPLSNGDYTISHTSDTLLFDADGTFAGFIAYTPPNVRRNETVAAQREQEAVERLKELVDS